MNLNNCLMDSPNSKSVLISDLAPDEHGNEGVFAIISPELADHHTRETFSYRMEGYFLRAPIPKGSRGGFSSPEEAETAARDELRRWRTEGVPTDTMVTRQEYWSMTYYSNRYLQHLTPGELSQRHLDIMNNLMTLEPDNTIGILPMDKRGDYFAAAYSHVISESDLRGGLLVDRSQKPYPNYEWPGISTAAAAFDQMKLEPGSYLLKFSKYEYLRPMLDRGAIRIAPASIYDDPSLNKAIRDDELELKLRPSPVQNADLTQAKDELVGPIPSIGSSGKVLRAATNYYVYCLAAQHSLRLYADFEADACIVIRDPIEFVTRILEAVKKELPDWDGFGASVIYIDPVQPLDDQINVLTYKDFRYAYQKEFRIIWTPPDSAIKLDFINIELGNLEDCCDLISLTV